MSKNQDNITLAPAKREDLYNDDYKIGMIKLTKEEKVVLSQLVGTRAWDVIKNAYVKQRALQIAVTSVNTAQNDIDLWFCKGKASEANYIIKDIERIVEEFVKSEKNKS